MSERTTGIAIDLLSDACFGASRLTTVVDVDLCTQVDDLGLPFIGGRILKGLVDEQAAVILRAVGSARGPWESAAREALGEPGAVAPCLARFGDAVFPSEVRALVESVRVADPGFVTRAFTEVRAQTRMDELRGTAADHSLRTTRLVRQGTQHLRAGVSYGGEPLDRAPPKPRALLVAAIELVRRAGVNRSRGWGRVQLAIEVADATLALWRKPLLDVLRGNAR